MSNLFLNGEKKEKRTRFRIMRSSHGDASSFPTVSTLTVILAANLVTARGLPLDATTFILTFKKQKIIDLLVARGKRVSSSQGGVLDLRLRHFRFCTVFTRVLPSNLPIQKMRNLLSVFCFLLNLRNFSLRKSERVQV